LQSNNFWVRYKEKKDVVDLPVSKKRGSDHKPSQGHGQTSFATNYAYGSAVNSGGTAAGHHYGRGGESVNAAMMEKEGAHASHGRDGARDHQKVSLHSSLPHLNVAQFQGNPHNVHHVSHNISPSNSSAKAETKDAKKQQKKIFFQEKEEVLRIAIRLYFIFFYFIFFIFFFPCA
jgi:hypothetical protein